MKYLSSKTLLVLAIPLLGACATQKLDVAMPAYQKALVEKAERQDQRYWKETPGSNISSGNIEAKVLLIDANAHPTVAIITEANGKQNITLIEPAEAIQLGGALLGHAAHAQALHK